MFCYVYHLANPEAKQNKGCLAVFSALKHFLMHCFASKFFHLPINHNSSDNWQCASIKNLSMPCTELHVVIFVSATPISLHNDIRFNSHHTSSQALITKKNCLSRSELTSDWKRDGVSCVLPRKVWNMFLLFCPHFCRSIRPRHAAWLISWARWSRCRLWYLRAVDTGGRF